MGHRKSFAEQVYKAQTMVSGLKDNKAELQKRGVTDEFIALLETTVNDVMRKNSEQERLKAALKAETASLMLSLSEMQKLMIESTAVVKLQMPKPRWIGFGITAKR